MAPAIISYFIWEKSKLQQHSKHLYTLVSQ
jgi:hypothetical protein